MSFIVGLVAGTAAGYFLKDRITALVAKLKNKN